MMSNDGMGEVYVLLNNFVQSQLVAEEGYHLIIVLRRLVAFVDHLLIDMADLVDGVLLGEAPCDERDFHMSVLRIDGGQPQGHQHLEEIVVVEAREGGG